MNIIQILYRWPASQSTPAMQSSPEPASQGLKHHLLEISKAESKRPRLEGSRTWLEPNSENVAGQSFLAISDTHITVIGEDSIVTAAKGSIWKAVKLRLGNLKFCYHSGSFTLTILRYGTC